jgi:hypothetical protein
VADETEILDADATLAVEKAAIPQVPPQAPNLSVPQFYRRKGVVQAVIYTGMNRDEMIRSAGAYIVNEDDALVVSVKGHPSRLFPGDVCILRRDPTNDDEKTEEVVGPSVWADNFELA